MSELNADNEAMYMVIVCRALPVFAALLEHLHKTLRLIKFHNVNAVCCKAENSLSQGKKLMTCLQTSIQSGCQFVPLPSSRMWYFIAAGVVAVISVLPQTREQVKDVPWTPIALIVGLGVLSDSLNESIRGVGTHSMARAAERYDIEPIPTIKPSYLWGRTSDQVVKRNCLSSGSAQLTSAMSCSRSSQARTRD